MLPDGRYEKGPESEPLTLKVGRSGTAPGLDQAETRRGPKLGPLIRLLYGNLHVCQEVWVVQMMRNLGISWSRTRFQRAAQRNCTCPHESAQPEAESLSGNLRRGVVKQGPLGRCWQPTLANIGCLVAQLVGQVEHQQLVVWDGLHSAVRWLQSTSARQKARRPIAGRLRAL